LTLKQKKLSLGSSSDSKNYEGIINSWACWPTANNIFLESKTVLLAFMANKYQNFGKSYTKI
jgi:hypothetical protein